MSLNSFKELEVWKKARLLPLEIREVTKSWPTEEKFRLIDQIVRSSRSVSANIAEGHGRYHYQENIQYCRMARGSLSKTIDHLICACDEGYITNEKNKLLENEILIIAKMLNSYITYLRKQKSAI